ncbi:MAG: DNA-protecting protein DprA [Anaerolineae bacterium]|nr:DNA-protecting protein DprA [Anaerolineae bacterium]MDW8172283.1 DNA-processing protein DprA [Anaerolineae bacterium]
MDTAWVALGLVPRLGANKLRALCNHFGSAQAALRADEAALRQVAGIGPTIAQAITQLQLEQVEAQLARWQAQGVRVLPLGELGYPPPLFRLDDPPPLLFALGQDEPRLWADAIAIVGTRRPSPAAQSLAYALAAGLAARGATIVSGLALGIDRAAHEGALSAAGRSAAVLGNGVLDPYPPQNADLALSLRRRGALLCECPPDAAVSAQRLVARNRLISGLARALIVVETEVDGGAMHAARFALAQGQPLYVVESHASGNRALLDGGAHPLPNQATEALEHL